MAYNKTHKWRKKLLETDIYTAQNTPSSKRKPAASSYSNTETSLATSTLVIWSRVVESRDVIPHNFDGLAMPGLAFSGACVMRTCRPCDIHARTVVWLWAEQWAYWRPQLVLVEKPVNLHLPRQPTTTITTTSVIKITSCFKEYKF